MHKAPTSLHIPLHPQPSSTTMSEWLLNLDDYDQIVKRYETPHLPLRIRIPFTQPCAPIRRSYVIGDLILFGESFDSYLFQRFSYQVFY